MGAARASYPRFRREGDAPNVALTPGDIELLKRIYQFRFVRAADLYRLFGTRSADRLSRRLVLLYRAGYLDRPIAQIDRYGRGGSQSLVYGLDNAGGRYLKEEQGVPIGTANWRARNRAYGRQNLEHTLAVSSFLIDAELAVRAMPGVSFTPFEDIVAALPEEKRRDASALCWTVPMRGYACGESVQLAPDAMFGLRVERPDGKAVRSYFFVEVDRGTMTIVPSRAVRESNAFAFRATMLRKFIAYAESYQANLHGQLFGIRAIRTLFLTTTPARADALQGAARELVLAPMKLPEGLFSFGMLDAIPAFLHEL